MTNEIVEIKESKVSRFFKKIGKRNIIIACAVLVIGAAVVLNWVLLAKAESNGNGYNGYDKPAGNLETTDTGKNDGENKGTPSNSDNTDSFFSSTQISRERARDEAMEVLQSVIDNKVADDATRAAAVADMAVLAKNMEAEANIETLITAKGFAQCVAVINDEKANIIVKCDGELTQAQIAQINEIVYLQAGIKPASINIIKK